jgi:hypothetical protein
LVFFVKSSPRQLRVGVFVLPLTVPANYHDGRCSEDRFEVWVTSSPNF